MSTHHVVAARPTPRGFLDTTPARDFLHSWYRTYKFAGEPDAMDDRRAVVRPIFPASFNLANFLSQQVARGVTTVVITSASSKTAIGMVNELCHRPEASDVSIIGLTAPVNLGFVKQAGRYDTVGGYPDLASIPVSGPAVFVDFTGTATQLRAVYDHCAPQLRHTALVGYTHPGAAIEPPKLPDPKPEIFFTPAVEAQAAAQEGAEAYYARYQSAEDRFIAATRSWLTLYHRRGPEAIANAFRHLLAGEQAPDVCEVCSP